MSKQVIEPYDFQCKTNIEEHNDIVNKVNEIVGVVNDMDVEEITKDISALESEVSAQGNEIDAINTEIAGLPTKAEVNNGDITAVAIDKTSEGIEIQLTKPTGVLEDDVMLPFINTATLIPTSTERAFKIRFTYTDGTQYDTNEFVIPEGGGTDVSVTGVTVEDGTAPNSFKVAIQLSDASTIASNDYEIDIPAQQNTYPTSVSGTLSGTTLTLIIGLNNSTNVTGTVDLSAFLTKTEASSTYATKTEVSTTYATKTEVIAVDTKVTAIGVTSEGNNVTVNGKNATIIKSVSGQVIDGNLKITVNGVESGDIPLPDNELAIINGTGITTSNVNIQFSSNKLSFSSIEKDAETIDAKTITLNSAAYVGGPHYKSLFFGSATHYFTTEMLSGYKYTPSNDIVLNISSQTINNVGLENGNYKLIVDCLNTTIDQKIERKVNSIPTESEFIEFTISNTVMSVPEQTITLPAESFRYGLWSSATLNKIFFLVDRIIKVN